MFLFCTHAYKQICTAHLFVLSIDGLHDHGSDCLPHVSYFHKNDPVLVARLLTVSQIEDDDIIDAIY